MKKVKLVADFWIIISVVVALVSTAAYFEKGHTGLLVLAIAGLWSTIVSLFFLFLVLRSGVK